MKTGFWLKGGKGKLAGATVYQQNGETVMREVVSPTNPKTEKQIIQRIVMHTVMQSYSKMKDISDESGESFDELFIERSAKSIWVHFAVRPEGNRQKVDFLRK